MLRAAFAFCRRFIFALLIALVAMPPLAPAAQAAADAPQDTPTPVVTNEPLDGWALDAGLLYWTNDCFGEEFNKSDSTIKRQPVGGGIRRTLDTTPVEKCLTYLQPAAADDGVYYYDEDETRLEHIGLSEPYSPTVVTDIPNDHEPSVTPKVSGDYIYWPAFLPGKILRAPRAGGDIETVAEGLDSPTDVLVAGSRVYWTDSDGISSILTSCDTLPCTDTKASYWSFGTDVTGFGLLYSSNGINYTLTWVERTSTGGGNADYVIRRRTCGFVALCSLVTPTLFHAAASNWSHRPAGHRRDEPLLGRADLPAPHRRRQNPSQGDQPGERWLRRRHRSRRNRPESATGNRQRQPLLCHRQVFQLGLSASTTYRSTPASSSVTYLRMPSKSPRASKTWPMARPSSPRKPPTCASMARN